jgi:hypothetical protein
VVDESTTRRAENNDCLFRKRMSQEFAGYPFILSEFLELCNDDEHGNLTSVNPKQAQVII